jgi:serine/threonine protein kinase
MSEPPSEPQDDAGKKPADDDAARRERDIDRLARCIADGEPLAGDVGDTGTHFAAFVELQNVVDGFRRVQQRFANRQPAKSPSFRFGQLEVLDKLGEGAQAEVYRAYDPLLDQCFALKIRRIEFGALSNDFLEEAKHLARVHHPNVVRVYGAANVDGRAGLWTELINGQSLESVLASTPVLSLHDAIEIGCKLCEALEALHTRGLVHGDIKPSNVMLEDSGRVVLMDFGAAQRFRNSTPRPVTLGTVQYLAPEVADGCASSPQSDIYSLGVLLFKLLTGAYPYTASDFEGLCIQQSTIGPAKLASLAPAVPSGSAGAIDRALATDPQRRHRGMSAFAAALRPHPPVSGMLKISVALASVCVGAVLAGGIAWTIRKNAAEESDTSVNLVRETAKEGREALQSGSVLNLGDKLAVEFRSTYPAYVYIFGSSEDNKATVLFPISGAFPINPLAPGVPHHIPGSVGGQLLDWQVVTDATSEEVVVLAATEPQPDLDREIAGLDQANMDAPVISTLPRSLSHLAPAPEVLTVGSPYLREIVSKARQSDANGKIRVWDFRLPHARPPR